MKRHGWIETEIAMWKETRTWRYGKLSVDQQCKKNEKFVLKGKQSVWLNDHLIKRLSIWFMVLTSRNRVEMGLYQQKLCHGELKVWGRGNERKLSFKIPGNFTVIWLQMCTIFKAEWPWKQFRDHQSCILSFKGYKTDSLLPKSLCQRLTRTLKVGSHHSKVCC